jgi:hypothetical protein
VRLRSPSFVPFRRLTGMRRAYAHTQIVGEPQETETPCFLYSPMDCFREGQVFVPGLENNTQYFDAYLVSARCVTLISHWVTLISRWVTLRARWVRTSLAIPAVSTLTAPLLFARSRRGVRTLPPISISPKI